MAETRIAQKESQHDAAQDLASILLCEDSQSGATDPMRPVWHHSSPCTETSSSEEDDGRHPDSGESTEHDCDSKSNGDSSTAASMDLPRTIHDGVDRRGNPAACIFVASLTKDKNDEELNVSVSNHFAQWGDLLNVKVLKDWMGRPYAFVQYQSTADAGRALREAPGTILDGRSIRCEPARVNRTLCLIALDHPLNKEDLYHELSMFGSIEDITLLPPRGRNYCAFLKYNYRDDAIKAFLMLRMPQYAHRWCVEWASNLDLNSPDVGFVRTDRTSVFIGNLFDTVTDGSMYSRFGQYGTIVYLRVIRKPIQHGRKRIFAFVKYVNEQEATAAIERENGETWADRVLRVAYREHHDSISSFYRGNGRRQHFFERPHPPGLGFPASIYQYLSIGRPPPTDATSTAPAPASRAITGKLSPPALTEVPMPALSASHGHSASSKSSDGSQHGPHGSFSSDTNQPHSVVVPSTLLSRPNTRPFVPTRPIATTLPAYPYHGTTYYDVCAPVMPQTHDGTAQQCNKNQGPADKATCNDNSAYVPQPGPMYDYYGYFPMAGYYPAPPPCENCYDPYYMYPGGYMYPTPPAQPGTAYATSSSPPIKHPTGQSSTNAAYQGQDPPPVANGSKEMHA